MKRAVLVGALSFVGALCGAQSPPRTDAGLFEIRIGTLAPIVATVLIAADGAMLLPVEPILADLEGQTTALGAPVDPSTVKLVGNVGQQASYLGTVRHRGWRVGRLALPPLAASAARQVVTPAEVEIG